MDKRRILLKHCPFSTGGYMSRARMGWSILLTFYVETEVLVEFPVPKSSMQGWQIWYKETGNFLGCMFWSFEWEKNLNEFDLMVKEMISLSCFKEASSPPTPVVAWVNNGKVVVFTTFSFSSTRLRNHSSFRKHGVSIRWVVICSSNSSLNRRFTYIHLFLDINYYLLVCSFCWSGLG